MEKATLLTASKVDLSVSSPRSDITRLIGPALQIALRFQSLVGCVTVFLCSHACFFREHHFRRPPAREQNRDPERLRRCKIQRFPQLQHVYPGRGECLELQKHPEVTKQALLRIRRLYPRQREHDLHNALLAWLVGACRRVLGILDALRLKSS